LKFIFLTCSKFVVFPLVIPVSTFFS